MADYIDIAELRSLAKKATPGPWYAPDRGEAGNVINGDGDQICCEDNQIVGDSHNMQHIAAANPATVLALVRPTAEALDEALAPFRKEDSRPLAGQIR